MGIQIRNGTVYDPKKGIEGEKMDIFGTIEKVSDFLIFHPSYPTFSSCLQIVNNHKVISH